MSDQTVTEQVGDPFAVLRVGLAAWYLLDVGGVADHEFEVALENKLTRLPIFVPGGAPC